MRTKVAIALATVYIVWGSTYLAIAVADQTLPPLLMLAVRFGIAGAILYGWSLWRGDVAARRPGRREWTAAAIVGGLLAEAFLALAIVLPGLLVQDTYRYAFVAKGVPMHAFACDLTWAVILVPALIFVGNGPTTSLAVPILVWGGSGIISAGVGMALGRTLPSVRQARAWFVGTRDLGLRYAAEALIAQAPFQITLFVLGSVAGLAATASLRGAQVLLGPIGMLIIGLSIVGVPEGVRRYRSSGARALRGPTALLSLGAAALTLVWGLALGLLPVEVGEKILGDTWSGASAVLAPVTLGWIGNTLAFGATVGLRVLADSRRSLVGRSTDASAEATGGVLGAFAGAAFGAALGLAIGQLFGIFAWWFMFDRAIKASVARGVPSAAPMTEEEEFLELSQASPDPGTAGLPIDDAMTDRQGGA